MFQNRLMKESHENQSETIRQMTERAIDSFHAGEVERYKRGEFPEILKRIEASDISKEKMVEVISTRYQVAHFFEDMLRRIIRGVEASELATNVKAALIHSVQVNLNEELGEVAEYGGPHREGREVLLNALGVDYETWKKDLGIYENLGKLNPIARELVESLKRIIDTDPIAAVAMLYSYEDKISLDGVGDYHKLLAGLEKLYPELAKADSKYVEGDALWHIYSHADHDEHHAALAKSGLVESVSTEADLSKLQTGMTRAKIALDTFWNNLEEGIK